MSIHAVRVHRFTDPETLVVDRIDAPAPADMTAVVRVQVASVNPVDWKTAEGQYPPVGEDKLPIVLGRDLAGVIASIGSGLDGWAAGDRVCAFIGQDRGAQTEQVLVAAEELVRIPDGISTDVAGALPLAAMTAWQGLFDHGGLQEGQRVLIHGAAGGVGHLAVQFARWKNCTIFATASADDLAFVRGLGADTVIDYENERFDDIATDLDLVFDTQGGETQARSFATLKRGGMLVSTLEPDEARAAELGIRTVPRWHAEADAAALGRVLDLIVSGDVRVEIARCFTLDQIADAHRFARNDHPRGKVILTV
ncbi:NADP-dependent oxidoreductase [Sphingomonas sp. R86520]|uniref:NADP-dependent oxidoreductase n=1 Tax=Sphingomonas sp. R86520 TaxID=3093859 RepID=UPI0036D3E21A